MATEPVARSRVVENEEVFALAGRRRPEHARSGGMVVLVGTYGAADGAAGGHTPPGLGGWLMGGCWGAGACFGVFCSQGVAAGSPRYLTLPSPFQLPHTPPQLAHGTCTEWCCDG